MWHPGCRSGLDSEVEVCDDSEGMQSCLFCFVGEQLEL